MDHTQASRWLDDYVAAWRSNKRSEIEALFTPDATYRYAPYEEPLVGAAAIAESWLTEPDDPATWEAAYEPVAVEGDTVVAIGLSRYRETDARPARTYHNCYLLRFAQDGRCRDFTEWFMPEPS